jgi:V/A-type H+-transporting ATPase subunit F
MRRRTKVMAVGKMSKKREIAVIGDEDTVIAFGLTGIKHLISVKDVSNDKEILKSIISLIENPEIGFIILTQPIAESIRDDFERIKQEKTLYPIFIEIPDKKGEMADIVDPIKILIRRAIGMDVVKNK